MIPRTITSLRSRIFSNNIINLTKYSTCDCDPNPCPIDKLPPCPEHPLCPPRVCPPTPSSGDPCHYTPPPPDDPYNPDLTKIKKKQCLFQEDNGIPVYLKGGSTDSLIFQGTVFAILIGFGMSLHKCYTFVMA